VPIFGQNLAEFFGPSQFGGRPPLPGSSSAGSPAPDASAPIASSSPAHDISATPFSEYVDHHNTHRPRRTLRQRAADGKIPVAPADESIRV